MGFNSMWTVNFQMVLEKAEEPEIKLHISAGSSKKQESSRKKHLFLLYWLCQRLCVDHNKLCKILKEMGIPDHLTCLLRNLYASQKATVRTGHGTTDWFQIGKGVRQGCVLSPCLFNFYAEYKSQCNITLLLLEWISSKRQEVSFGKDVGKREPLPTIGGNWCSCYEK